MLVVQRPTDGFLGGLWEFPAVPTDGRETDPRQIENRLEGEIGLKIEIERPLTRIRHAYTHFKLSADVFVCRFLSGRVRLNSAQGHRWVTLRSLNGLPLHKVTHKFMDALVAAIESRDNQDDRP
jgi:A/G-specific adenine glycosylase